MHQVFPDPMPRFAVGIWLVLESTLQVERLHLSATIVNASHPSSPWSLSSRVTN